METNVKIAWQYKDNGMFALLWGDTAAILLKASVLSYSVS